MKKLISQARSQGGFTLVELMIVVAVIGILASIASVSYVKYIRSAEVGKLKQYAMEVANAQEMYKSQNAGYLNVTPNYAEGNAVWEQVLGFSKKGLSAQGITIETKAGDGSGAQCGICEGVIPDKNKIWFGVRVKRDFGNEITTIVMTNELESPIELTAKK